MRWAGAVLISAGVGVAASSAAQAYIATVTQGGAPVTWRGDHKLNLAGNPVNRSHLDPEVFSAAVVRSLQRWQAASGGQLKFDYWQGSDPSIFNADSLYNGLSSLYFASNSPTDSHLSPNVLGLTQVWYDTTNGQILETDIVLNDQSFLFTPRPEDTSGYGSGGPTGSVDGLNRVYVENVLTHELGHAFGLSHSAGLQSTMLFMESPEQAHLGCDEQVGVRAMYPGADQRSRGALGGSVVTAAGDPVFGAHVVAISRQRGTVIATGLSDSSGRYRIAALEPGTYFLMIEPYYAGPGALSSYYAAMKPLICSGLPFARSFLVDAGGVDPLPIQVNPGGNTEAPSQIAHCDGEVGAHVRGLSAALTDITPPEIFSGASGGFGVTQKFDRSSTASYYKLKGVSGHLEIHALSFSLYSPVRAGLTLMDSRGRNVTAAVVSNPAYQGDSGYINYDSSLRADGLEAGDYTVRVDVRGVDPLRYPGGTLSLDTTAFLLLTGSVNETPPALGGAMPENARCRMDENFPLYTRQSGNPPRASVDRGGDTGGGGFCGRVLDSKPGSSGDTSESSTPGQIAGWFLPWVVMLLMAKLARRVARNTRRVKFPISACAQSPLRIL